jgi:hypothetical protein
MYNKYGREKTAYRSDQSIQAANGDCNRYIPWFYVELCKYLDKGCVRKIHVQGYCYCNWAGNMPFYIAACFIPNAKNELPHAPR